MYALNFVFHFFTLCLTRFSYSALLPHRMRSRNSSFINFRAFKVPPLFSTARAFFLTMWFSILTTVAFGKFKMSRLVNLSSEEHTKCFCLSSGTTLGIALRARSWSHANFRWWTMMKAGTTGILPFFLFQHNYSDWLFEMSGVRSET